MHKEAKQQPEKKPLRELGKKVLRQVSGGAGTVIPEMDGSKKDAG
jgi:hypothetical protein